MRIDTIEQLRKLPLGTDLYIRDTWSRTDFRAFIVSHDMAGEHVELEVSAGGASVGKRFHVTEDHIDEEEYLINYFSFFIGGY